MARGQEVKMMARYPSISDHGLIGDLQTAALVATDGTVDWFCCPRFDSPSVCASLLDADRGGYFRVGPDRDDYVSKQLYFPDTAVLITRFMTPDGVGEVCDFMPVERGAATDRHRLVRQLRVVRGTMRFVMDFQPRFDYARQPHKLELSEDGAVFQADGMVLTLHTVGTPGTALADLGVTVERHGDGLRAARTLRAGQTGGVVLETMGRDARDRLFLQMREATASVLETHLPKSRYRQHGERVVQGQRPMQAASDIYLGWTKGVDVRRHFYWRQLRDMKGSAVVEAMTPLQLTFCARICGWTLARAHARSGDPVAIAAYLGDSGTFDRSITDFSQRYANQNEHDFQQFVKAVRTGRLKALEGV
jgi:hypothetical protein